MKAGERTPPGSRLRLLPLLRLWHLWVGLLAGAVLAVVGLSGAVFSFERELRATFGERVNWTSLEDLASPGELRAALHGEGLEGEPIRFLWPADLEEPLWIRWKTPAGKWLDLQVDPSDGALLPRATALQTFFQFILGLHRTLTVGKVGSIVTGTSALVLAFLVVSGCGLLLQRPPGRRLGLSRRERQHPRRRIRWMTWHRLVGVGSAPGLLLLALTGPVFSFGWYTGGVIWLGNQLGKARVSTAAKENPGMAARPPQNEAKALDLDAVWATAKAHLPPPGRPFRLSLPTSASAPATFAWSPENAPNESFRSTLRLDPATGSILEMRPIKEMSRGVRWRRWFYPLHTGRLLGWPSQLWLGLSALAMPFLFLGGVYLACARRSRERVNQRPRDEA